MCNPRKKITIQYWKQDVNFGSRKTAGQWYFHILARNNKIIAASEGYLKRTACLKTIALIKHDDWEVEEV